MRHETNSLASTEVQAELIYRSVSRLLNSKRANVADGFNRTVRGGLPGSIYSHFAYEPLPGFSISDEPLLKINTKSVDGEFYPSDSLVNIIFSQTENLHNINGNKRHIFLLAYSVVKEHNERDMKLERTISHLSYAVKYQVANLGSEEYYESLARLDSPKGPEDCLAKVNQHILEAELLERELGFRGVSFQEANDLIEVLARFSQEP